MIDFPMIKYKKNMTELLSSLIHIPSVKGEPKLNMPYGKDVFRALMFMLDEAERMDLVTCNLFGQMGYVEYGSGDEVLAILTHLDVVPAGEGWETDPFTAVEKDGKIYGRGAVDDKGPAVAALIALYALKENCVSLGKRVRVFFGCDEESGWGDIDFYKENYPDPEYVISPDASFPIINREKGVLHLRVTMPLEGAPGSIVWADCGTRTNIVPNKAECTVKCSVAAAQKAAARTNGTFELEETEWKGVRILSKGKAAHGSHPAEGKNALVAMIKLLKRMDLVQGGIERFLFLLDKLVGERIDGRDLGIKCSDDLSGELTVNLATLKVSKDSISATMDIRFPISKTVDQIYEKVRQTLEKYGLRSEKAHCLEPHYVDEENSFIKALKEAYEECFQQKAECLCCAGATYARAFQNSVAFGPVPKERPSVEHGPNEYIMVDDLVKLAEALATAIVKLAGTPEGKQEDCYG